MTLNASNRLLQNFTKKCNLIFHNISEPIELAPNDQQKQKDTEIMSELVNRELNISKIQAKRVVRLGTHKSGPSRSHLAW